MILAAHQPHYLPWLRYFDKNSRADVFVVLDDVQYNKNGWQNRNRIKGASGPVLLSVPVQHRYQAPLPEVTIDGDRWRRQHLMSLRTSYGRSPGFERVFPPLAALLGGKQASLVELNQQMLTLFLDLLGIRTEVVLSSTLKVEGIATERLANLCRKLGASHYLSGGHAARTYLDAPLLARAGIRLLHHEWTAPVYEQAHPRAGFVADLSIVDLLASDPDRAPALLGAAGGAREDAGDGGGEASVA